MCCTKEHQPGRFMYKVVLSFTGLVLENIQSQLCHGITCLTFSDFKFLFNNGVSNGHRVFKNG